ncbi:aspartate aminotransferase family protein [Pusillimonas sp. TS35]|uniref:aspartate aminotransferase family protein n=1 Tax=Paracandidimonas lactea TaxID=2895524 RepID=UPI00136AF8BB|nr:aspartate aminotransferase family protein [Paracandidimonas lactea]MYN14349.1 aspartate aminotransferase family protein [Pusillimonas sp. TS35]
MTNILHRTPLLPTPPVAVQGEGSFIIDASGKRYYDACGGAAVSCIGHAHPAVADAVAKQVRQIEYAHTGFFTSEPAEALAAHLAAHSPTGLDSVYFLSSGSEAVETALKMARQFHVDNGEPERSTIISRRQSYHGNTLGALAIGGNVARRALYEPLLASTIQVTPCYAYRYQHKHESTQQYVLRLADELEQAILAQPPRTVAAFVAETVVGATAGAVAPVPGYFHAIRDVCDRYGVLLILDEVMSGMGRTGTYHAFEQEGVEPDILCLAKGLGGGFQPIGAVMAQRRIVETIVQASGAFMHGHTYVGHPVACAGALAVQQVIESEGLVARCAELGLALTEMLAQRLGSHPNLGEIRGRGLFQAVELVADRDTGAPFDPKHQMHARIKREAMQRGLLCYPGGGTIDGRSGDHVLLAPPYTTNINELSAAVDILAAAIDAAISTTATAAY